jgi:hypothetical protein
MTPKPDINLAQTAHTLAKTLTYMGKPTMSRVADRIGNHVTEQNARIEKLEALLRETVTNIEFDELGLHTLYQKIIKELVQS